MWFPKLIVLMQWLVIKKSPPHSSAAESTRCLVHSTEMHLNWIVSQALLILIFYLQGEHPKEEWKMCTAISFVSVLL